jgi:hypothetical protein
MRSAPRRSQDTKVPEKELPPDVGEYDTELLGD